MQNLENLDVFKILITQKLLKCLFSGPRSNAFYWRQIFALDSVVAKAQKLFSSYGGFLTNAMHYHGETI